MASKALEKSAKLMARRLLKAGEYQTAIVEEFEKRYERYIFGPPHFADDAAREEYYTRVNDNPDVEAMKEGWDATTFPLHGMYRNVMLPYMMSNDPVFINRQRLGAGAMEMALIDLHADLSHTIWYESETTDEFKRALDDAFCYRMGWMKTCWDKRMMLPAHQWVDARNMLFDCETRSPRIRDKRWVAEKLVLPIETAEWFAKNVWDAAKHDFEGVEYEDADDTVKTGSRARGENTRRMQEAGKDVSQFVRLIQVEVKGENPHTTSAKFDQKKMNDPAGTDDVYDGKDHVLILEACGGWNNTEHYKPVARIDWQFPCKRGEFTYTPIVLTKDNRGPYPYSVMQPGHSAQVATDLSIQAYNTDLINSARRWIAYTPEAFQDEAQAQGIVEGDAALMVAALKGNQDPNRAIAAGNFGSPNPASQQGFAQNRENYEAVQGMNKFDVQVRANQTAYNTGVQNEAAQVKIDDVSAMVERAVVKVAEKGVMCARANMTSEDLKEWINIPEQVDGEPVEVQRITKAGVEVIENILWSDNPDWGEIRREVTINLEPRSIRFNNPQKEAEDIETLMGRQLEVFRVIGDTVGKGAVTAAQEIARSWNEALRAVCTLKNIANYERFLIDFASITQPEAPQVDPNQMAKLEVESQGQQLNAQQQAAQTRLQQQGLAMEAMPQDMQGGG